MFTGNMMVRSRIAQLALLACFGNPSFAADDSAAFPEQQDAAAAGTPSPCPDRSKLRNICMMIGARMPDRQNKNKYLYQTKFEEASCVDPGDSPERVSEKIRATWDRFHPDLKCSATTFDVDRGSLLKYAFVAEFDDFLNDAIRWKLDLNEIDASDDRTLLDYVRYYIDRNRGNSLEQRYKNYYDKLRRAGARHKSELPAAAGR